MSTQHRFFVAGAWSTAFALISALSRPDEEALATLTAAGLSDQGAVWAAHVIPVLAAAAAMGLGPLLLRPAKQQFVRFIGYGVLGALVGATTAQFLVAFARLEGVFAWAGPMREATPTDIAAWAVAGISVLYGLMAQALAMFGTNALRAIAVDEAANEACIELRRRDRQNFALGAVGMIGQGVFLAAAALANGAVDPGPAVQGVIAVLALAGVGLFAWSSGRLWFIFDEFERRMVMDAYAWSAILMTPALFGWVVLEGLGRTPPLSGYAALVILILLQTVVTFIITARAGGAVKAQTA